MKGRVLIVAGSDSGGGAGIQADIKTVTMLGGFAATAITALTAQNTLGVHGVHAVPAAFVAQQMRVVLEDIGADAIKTGMLLNAEIIHAIADVLEDYPAMPLILDPVMIAKGGAPLLQSEAMDALRTRLVPRATVLTPNLPEAEHLLGKTISTEDEMVNAAKALQKLGAKAVILKGGHSESQEIVDVLREESGEISTYRTQRIATNNTHGTGCTMASAIATGLAQGMPLPAAAARAHAYVQKAIASAPTIGHGHGPLNHGWILET